MKYAFVPSSNLLKQICTSKQKHGKSFGLILLATENHNNERE